MDMPISTRDLSALPSPSQLERLCQSIAMLDAIMSPEWQYRYFSFNRAWAPPAGERMASMRNGSGDQYFMVFGPAGVFAKGFAHEASMTPWARNPRTIWPGVTDAVPAEFKHCLDEPAFEPDAVTFCFWRLRQDDQWRRGNIQFPEGADPDGSADLLWMLDGNPATYVQFAQDYFERDISLHDVESVYEHRPLTQALVASLNIECALSDIASDVSEIGYPG